MNTTPNARCAALNFLCAALMLVLLVLQFMPFWSYGDPAQSVSIQEYIWLPGNHSALDKVLKDTVNPDYNINDILIMPILTLITGAAGIILCLLKSKNAFVSLLPAACGLIGLWGYLTNPVFHAGSGWVLHMLVCIALLAVSVVHLVMTFKPAKA